MSKSMFPAPKSFKISKPMFNTPFIAEVADPHFNTYDEAILSALENMPRGNFLLIEDTTKTDFYLVPAFRVIQIKKLFHWR